MATTRRTDLDGKYLLVSDSNEISNQLDSKKLDKDSLVELMQENLFRKHLGLMSSYLTLNQFKTQEVPFKDEIDIQNDVFNQLKDLERNGKFSVVDGQVILIDRVQFDNFNKDLRERELQVYTPQEYLRAHWNITSEYSIVQMQNCMMRGITYMESEDPDFVNRPQNQTVELRGDNIPQHMHHSSVTTGANIQSVVEVDFNGAVSIFKNGSVVYDMFNNDSFNTGMVENEMEGVVDNFSVQQNGGNIEPEGTSPGILHNNLPEYKEYYVFEIRKTTIS